MKGRARAWGEFSRWCESRGLQALPAHAWTVATYLRWKERHRGADEALEVIAAISREHLLKGKRSPKKHPLIQRTITLIETRAETRGLQSALFDTDDILSDAAKPKPKPKPKTKTAKKATSTKPKRSLSDRPKLVSRRPTP